jgi:predicted nucleotidyltransferase
MIDLEPKDLEIVRMILQQYVPGYRVVVFGSRAKKTVKRRSDLDLCLIGENPLSIGTIAALEDAFSSSALDIKVDVVDWGRTQASFQEIIEKESLVIQESKNIH